MLSKHSALAGQMWKALIIFRLLEKPHANEEFVQVGRDIDSSATGVLLEIPIHKLDWLNLEYLLETCTSAECSSTDSISVHSYMRRAIGYIKSSNTENHDRFGRLALSADGNTLAVASPGDDSAALGINGDDGNNSASGAGAVYIFHNDGENWVFQAYIKASNTDEADEFGHSLSLSSDGNTLAVGAPFEDSSATGIEGDESDNSLLDAGAVYVF